jgi:hypothetical protein
MNQPSKLMLSPHELQLVTDTNLILTKRTIIDKVCQLFGTHAQAAQQTLQNVKQQLPQNISSSSPKISKGENYLQLPWVMLDYPRCFEKENVFAMRSFFWWGHFFSVTLQLGGEYKKMLEQNILTHTQVLQQNNYYLCIGNTPWQHHLQADNYAAAAQLTKAEIEEQIMNRPFIKITATHSLQHWHTVLQWLDESFCEMINLAIR